MSDIINKRRIIEVAIDDHRAIRFDYSAARSSEPSQRPIVRPEQLTKTKRDNWVVIGPNLFRVTNNGLEEEDTPYRTYRLDRMEDIQLV